MFRWPSRGLPVWPPDSLCTDLVLFVEFVSGREKASDVLGHFHILLQRQTQRKILISQINTAVIFIETEG